jgi:hypothetical protein
MVIDDQFYSIISSPSLQWRIVLESWSWNKTQILEVENRKMGKIENFLHMRLWG